MVSSKVYNNLELWRTSKGLSRADLAKELGINYQTVGYIERGDFAPSIQLCLHIAEYFGTQIENIFSLEPLKVELSISKKESK